MLWLASFLALAVTQTAQTMPFPAADEQPPTPAPPEVRVRAVLDDLREAEMLLDADATAEALAHAFSVIDNAGRVVGRFAYLETLRRARSRGDTVRELVFDRLDVQVFGASAVATYHYRKRWRENGVTHLREGWCTDVFELRDDGAWILVHRHRAREPEDR